MNFEIAPKYTETKLNWWDAKLYCFALNIRGKTGWRLPTKEELGEMYKTKNNLSNGFYWSSTENGADFAWYQTVLFNQLGSHGHMVNKLSVRAVRSI
jgi:hypothetical protein